MPVYEKSGEQIVHLSHGRLDDLKRGERSDIFALLRENVTVLANDLYLISDDTDQWNKTEQIDLLAVDKDKNIVAIEVLGPLTPDKKCLPIVRYGTLLPSFTFSNLVAIHQAHLDRKNQKGVDAKAAILKHFGATSTAFKDDELLDLRIVMVSREFTTQTITTANWIKLDVRCYQLSFFDVGVKTLINVDQVVPKISPEEMARRLKYKLEPTINLKEKKAPTPAVKTEQTSKPAPAKPKEEAKSSASATSSGKSVETKSGSSTSSKPVAKSSAPAVSKPAAKPVPPKAKPSTTKPAVSKSVEPEKKPTAPKPVASQATPAKTAKPSEPVGKDKKTKPAAQLDRGKYVALFNGVRQKPTAKRRVVLQTITHLIKNGIKPDAIPSKVPGIDDIFIRVPGNVDHEKFKKLAAAERKKANRTFDAKRYFCLDDELIKLKGYTYSIINQWTLDGFIEIMEMLKTKFPKYRITYKRDDS